MWWWWWFSCCHCPIIVTPWTVAHQAPFGISQARILEWVAMPSSRVSSPTRNQNHVSWIAGRFFIAEPILLLKRESLVEQPFHRSSQGNLRVIFEVLSICSDLQMEINQKCLDVKTQWFLAFSRSGVRNGKWLQCSGQSHTVKNCPA